MKTNASVTTSIRLSPELRKRLESAAHSMHRGKNWIITHALLQYLDALGYQNLAEEARRQSILASQHASKNSIWEDNTDTTGWK